MNDAGCCKPLIFNYGIQCFLSGDIQNCQKMHIVYGGKQNKGEGHTAYVMSIAISSDGKYLVILSANYNLMKIRC